MSSAEALDARLFPGALAPFRSTLLATRDAPVQALDRTALLEALTRFQVSVGGAWQPACSLWAQHYFNTLLIPATCLLAQEAVPCPAAITATFCPVSGRPLRCVLHTADLQEGAGGNGADLAGCFAQHVEAMVAELNVLARLSKGLLRESAERTVAWTLGEISLFDPAGARVARSLLQQERCSLRCLDACPAVRRFCCLRDRLPAVPSCGASCPRRWA